MISQDEPFIEEPSVPAIVPMELMQRAVASGADIAVLEKLMGLQERWETNQARKGYEAAMAAAKAEIKTINKSRQVDFTTNRGRTQYRYEDFGDIAEAVAPVLAKHGLSYRFRTDSTPELIAVTCIIAHRDGHSEQTTLSGPRDDTGNKNSMQAIGSAVTYLQRYTLKAALGLAAAVDDDAQSAGHPAVTSHEEYAERWRTMLDEARPEQAEELRLKWNSERTIRANILWPDIATRTRLQDLVMHQIDELKHADQVEQ